MSGLGVDPLMTRLVTIALLVAYVSQLYLFKKSPDGLYLGAHALRCSPPSCPALCSGTSTVQVMAVSSFPITFLPFLPHAHSSSPHTRQPPTWTRKGCPGQLHSFWLHHSRREICHVCLVHTMCGVGSISLTAHTVQTSQRERTFSPLCPMIMSSTRSVYTSMRLFRFT